MSAAAPTPVNGCLVCGEIKKTHGSKRGPGGGWHTFQAPTLGQRQERRAALAAAEAEAE